ncbi:putative maltose permease [Aureobasidium pullulans]|nr:putative maltose permease [Aureobasidium pullulans]
MTFFRICFFYVVSVFLLGLTIPYNSSQLVFATKSSTSAAASPFLVAVKLAKIQGLDHLLNGCLLVFVLSAANSDLYTSSRTLYGLALDGKAPKVFAWTNKRGVPIPALVNSSAFCLLAYMAVDTAAKLVFSYFLSVVSVFGLLTWVSILVSHICFCRAIKIQKISPESLAFRAPLRHYGSIGPLCTSEVAPVVLRGIATAGVNLGIAIGQLLSNAAVAGFGERDDHWAYRGPFALQLLFAVFLLVLLPFAPESPWWLVKKGKIEQAKKALEKLYGANVDIDNKLAALQSTVSNETRDGEVNFVDCFKGTNRIRTFISMGVFACQHLVGIIFVLGYSTYFFQLAGLDDSNSFGLGVGVTACGVTGNLVSWFVINNVGRRKLFVGGMVALTAMLLLIGIMDVVPTAGAKWAQSAITVVWAFVYFMTIGAMAFAILGETSNTSLRAHTAALATATQAVFGLAMNFAIPYMVNPDEGNLKGKVGFIFGGLGALATIWAWFFVPELKGRTFDEIDRMFSDRIPPRKMGTHVLL